MPAQWHFEKAIRKEMASAMKVLDDACKVKTVLKKKYDSEGLPNKAAHNYPALEAACANTCLMHDVRLNGKKLPGVCR